MCPVPQFPSLYSRVTAGTSPVGVMKMSRWTLMPEMAMLAKNLGFGEVPALAVTGLESWLDLRLQEQWCCCSLVLPMIAWRL